MLISPPDLAKITGVDDLADNDAADPRNVYIMSDNEDDDDEAHNNDHNEYHALEAEHDDNDGDAIFMGNNPNAFWEKNTMKKKLQRKLRQRAMRVNLNLMQPWTQRVKMSMSV